MYLAIGNSSKSAADTSAARVRLSAAPPPSRGPSQYACARVRSAACEPRALPTPPYNETHMKRVHSRIMSCLIQKSSRFIFDKITWLAENCRPKVRFAFLLCLLQSLNDLVFLGLNSELHYALLVVKAHLPDGHVPSLLQVADWSIDNVHII